MSDRWTPSSCAPCAVKCIKQDAEQPGSRISAGLETMEPAPGEQHGFLHEVFGGREVKRQAASHTQQGRKVRHCDALKFLLLRGHFASFYNR